MTTICIQCSLYAILHDQPLPFFEESETEHMLRCHPDLIKTQKERRELEIELMKKQAGLDQKKPTP